MIPPEDNPPLDPPLSIPPEPIEQFREPPHTVDTIPAPTTAEQVIEALSPKLDAILTEITLIKKHVGHLDAEIVDLRANRITTDATLGAIDRGVSAALNAVTMLDATVHHLKNAQTDTTNKVLELVQNTGTFQEVLTKRLDDRHDHVMARLVSLEDYRKVASGENDGSLVAAAALEGGE